MAPLKSVNDVLLSDAQRLLRDGRHDHLSEAVANARNALAAVRAWVQEMEDHEALFVSDGSADANAQIQTRVENHVKKMGRLSNEVMAALGRTQPWFRE